MPSHQWRPKNDALNFPPKDYAAIPSLSCFGTCNAWVSCGISVAAEGLFQAVFWGGRVSILQLSQNWSIFVNVLWLASSAEIHFLSSSVSVSRVL